MPVKSRNNDNRSFLEANRECRIDVSERTWLPLIYEKKCVKTGALAVISYDKMLLQSNGPTYPPIGLKSRFLCYLCCVTLNICEC